METNILAGRLVIVKHLYFYIVTLVALMMIVFSVADMLNILLKAYVFTKADFGYSNYYYVSPPCDPAAVAMDKTITKLAPEECDKLRTEAEKQQRNERVSQKHRDLARDIPFFVVGIPLFLLHWGYLRKNKAV